MSDESQTPGGVPIFALEPAPSPSPRGRRIVIALLAALAVGGSVGGYAIGRQSSQRIASQVQAAPSVPVSSAITHGTEVVTPTTAASAASPIVVAAATTVAPSFSSGSSKSASPSDAGYGNDGYGPTPQKLFVRTVRDGIVARVYHADFPTGQGEPGYVGFDGQPWTQPAACQATSSVLAYISTTAVTAELYGSEFGNVDQSILAGSQIIGHPNIEGYSGLLVQAASDVTSVRLLVDGTVVDEMTPIKGWAVLVGTISLTRPPTVDVVSPKGTTRLKPNEPWSRPECQPPPPPPPPLPAEFAPASAADAAQLEAAFKDAFSTNSGRVGPPTKLERVGDFPADYWATVAEKAVSFTQGPVTATIDKAGVKGDHAVVVYKLENTSIGWTYGEAIRTRDGWVVSAATFCRIVATVFACPTDIFDQSKDQGTPYLIGPPIAAVTTVPRA
jgi:hypothetical protein